MILLGQTRRGQPHNAWVPAFTAYYDRPERRKVRIRKRLLSRGNHRHLLLLPLCIVLGQPLGQLLNPPRIAAGQ